MDLEFALALLQIIGLDLVLAGDNAVVIALAARNLPPHLQRRAVIFGALAAVALRIVLTAGVVTLLMIPYLKLVGGLVLLYIAWKLVLDQHAPEDIDAADNLRAAIVTILMADVVMSLDNVLAVAAAAHGSYLLIVIGLLVSIPIVMGGASLLLGIVRRYPAAVWIGGALVAFTGIELALSDQLVHDTLHLGGWAERGVAAAATLATLLAIAARRRQLRAAARQGTLD